MTSLKRSRFSTPRTLYSDFRVELTELLSRDSSFKASYLAQEWESKLLDPEFSLSADERRTAAINKWLQCEELNRCTNIRLMHHDEDDVLFADSRGFPVSAVEVLQKARDFVLDCLSDAPPPLRGEFSNGASTSIRRGPGTVATKYLVGKDITEGAIWHFLGLTKSVQWAPRDFSVVRGNVLFTVPKSTTIDRCACKEPDFNMYVQKAIGNSIRKALRRRGVNLNDQTVNQELAREGARSGLLATVDLSSASDSVTTQLVLLLLPDAWFDLMMDVRSPITVIDGEEHQNEMFSSMGNAFTFELESLIFWALTRSVAFFTQIKGRISVYGDDIICPSGLKYQLQETLEFCGFRLNVKKSFFEGPFRESCGKHYFGSHDVTPFYVKSVPMDLSDWCHLLNSFRKWCRFGDQGILDPEYFDLWSKYSKLIPVAISGDWDYTSRKTLVSPGRKPIASLVRPARRLMQLERSLALGGYLQWLDTTADRVESSCVEVSPLVSEKPLMYRRFQCETRDRDYFPQELVAE